MTTHEKAQDSLDKISPELRTRNAKLEQERVDSLDHAKQSGKGESGNTLPKPPSEELAKP